VPFFGDQFFWGNVIEKNGVGPSPLPGKDITADDLAEAFKFVHEPETKAAAERIRDAILKENGCEEAVQQFHNHLPISRMRSDLESTYTACYRLEKFHLQLSRRVAQVLVLSGRIDESQLRLHSTRDWPSMYDNRVHLPFHGIIKHTHKAVVTIFSDASTGFKQAIHSDTWKGSTYSAAEGLVMGLGKGLGHLCIGCFSLYGELTDVLDAAPSYYDPYSESPIRSRPYVIDFRTGTHAAVLALVHGWKDGYTDLLNTPRVGYERHGKLGAVAGSLIGVANGLLKPLVGTLSSLTWFCRGIYANVSNEALTDKGTEACTVNTLGLDSSASDFINEKQKQQYNDDINQAVKAASKVTGFSPEVCQQIISEFDNIKEQKIDYRSRRQKAR
jgi:sterol 3beta-glucosyltransferase